MDTYGNIYSILPEIWDIIFYFLDMIEMIYLKNCSRALFKFIKIKIPPAFWTKFHAKTKMPQNISKVKIPVKATEEMLLVPGGPDFKMINFKMIDFKMINFKMINFKPQSIPSNCDVSLEWTIMCKSKIDHNYVNKIYGLQIEPDDPHIGMSIVYAIFSTEMDYRSRIVCGFGITMENIYTLYALDSEEEELNFIVYPCKHPEILIYEKNVLKLNYDSKYNQIIWYINGYRDWIIGIFNHLMYDHYRNQIASSKFKPSLCKKSLFVLDPQLD